MAGGGSALARLGPPPPACLLKLYTSRDFTFGAYFFARGIYTPNGDSTYSADRKRGRVRAIPHRRRRRRGTAAPGDRSNENFIWRIGSTDSRLSADVAGRVSCRFLTDPRSSYFPPSFVFEKILVIFHSKQNRQSVRNERVSSRFLTERRSSVHKRVFRCLYLLNNT